MAKVGGKDWYEDDGGIYIMRRSNSSTKVHKIYIEVKDEKYIKEHGGRIYDDSKASEAVQFINRKRMLNKKYGIENFKPWKDNIEKHIKGTKKFTELKNKAKSYFTLEPAKVYELLERRIGTGIVKTDINGGYYELVDVSSIIGYSIGQEEPTQYMIIVYSRKNGYHAYPIPKEYYESN